MSGIVCPSWHAGFASPQRGRLKYPQLWRGCVGAWAPCLGPTGLVLRDMSGFENHGTLTNMDAATDWVIGRNGHVLDLDGTDDFISIQNSAAFNSFGLTMTAWAKRSSDADTGYIICKNNNGGTSGPGIYHSGSSGNISLVGAVTHTTTSGLYGGTEWIHVAITYDGNSSGGMKQAFKNGRLTDTFSSVNALPGASWPQTVPVTIGTRTGSSATFSQLSGQLTDLRWYNRVLTDNEMLILATRPGISYETTRRRVFKSASVGYTLAVDTSAVVVTASDAGLFSGHLLAVDSSAVSVTASDVSLLYGSTLTVDTSAVSVTASDAGLFSGHLLAVDSDAVAATASDVSLLYGSTLAVDTSAVAVTASDAGLFSGHLLAVDSDAVAATASDVSLLYGSTLAVDTSAVVVTASDAGLFSGHLLAVDSDAVSVTFSAVGFGSAAVFARRSLFPRVGSRGVV